MEEGACHSKYEQSLTEAGQAPGRDGGDRQSDKKFMVENDFIDENHSAKYRRTEPRRGYRGEFRYLGLLT